MADYELYGDYNRGDDEPDEGPAPHPAIVWGARILRAACMTVLIAVCAIILVRVVAAEYYPSAMKDLAYTDPIASHLDAGGQINPVTQEISVPFESSDRGWFYADNLIVIPETGSLQCTVRINRRALETMRETYGLSELTLSDTTFRFVLENNAAYEARNPDSGWDKPEGSVTCTPAEYEASAVTGDSALFYHYFKVCFDGVDLTDVQWFRLKIYVEGVTYQSDESDLAAICIYENNDRYHTFEPYKLSKREEYLP